MHPPPFVSRRNRHIARPTRARAARTDGAPRAHDRNGVATIDWLEPRRLLAVHVDGFDVIVLGTDDADVIAIAVDPADAAFYAITLNGQTTRAAVATTARLRVATFAGDDVVAIDPSFGRLRAARVVDLGPGDDVFGGCAGVDVVGGGAGHDLILTGAGRDRLAGQEGNDTLVGGAGGDTADGGDDQDLVAGARGRDRLWGGEGHDSLLGGTGDDLLIGGAGNDSVYGASGHDVLAGDQFDLAFLAAFGTLENLVPFGTDLLDAGPGDDTIVGSLGADVFSGGSGVNRILPPTGSPLLVGLGL